VNVVLFPVLMGAVALCDASGLTARVPDLRQLLFMLWRINQGLLFFNLLPIFPLDGGQILRSLLWFRLGAGRSLQVAALIGLIGVPALALYAISQWSGNVLFIGFMAYFLWQQCLASFRHAKVLVAVERLPQHSEFSCPLCHQSPPAAPLWLCGACGQRFDAFATRGACPHCQTALAKIPCVHCRTPFPIDRWERFSPTPPAGPPTIEV
jgi:hypothetical protein